MKQKIKEALKQQYGTRANKELGQLQLGISDEVFERVAASVETFITDESAIDGFVKSEATLNLLKSYQSINDRLRTLEGKNEPPKPSDNSNQPEPNPNPAPSAADMAKAVADAVAAAIKPLSDELAAFKTEQKAKSAFAGAESAFKGNDYVKKYSEEAADAWERATEMYEATGKTWTADELRDKAMGYFNKAVGRKGVDTSVPFKSPRLKRFFCFKT